MLIVASCMRAVQGTGCFHRTQDNRTGWKCHLTAITLYQLVADLLCIVNGNVIRGYSPWVWQPHTSPILCTEQASSREMPGLPAGSARRWMSPAMTNAQLHAVLLMSKGFYWTLNRL